MLTLEWCSNCYPTLHIFLKDLQNNIIFNYFFLYFGLVINCKLSHLKEALDHKEVSEKGTWKDIEESIYICIWIIVFTSLCKLIKHLTRSPPIEWLIMFIFFPPEAENTISSFAAKPSIVSWNLRNWGKVSIWRTGTTVNLIETNTSNCLSNKLLIRVKFIPKHYQIYFN